MESSIIVQRINLQLEEVLLHSVERRKVRTIVNTLIYSLYNILAYYLIFSSTFITKHVKLKLNLANKENILIEFKFA